MKRALLSLCVLLSVAGAQPLRDPALPYGSWGEAARETEAAIGARPLARPTDGQYRVGDAVIVDDGGKRYRAHVTAIDGGRYRILYDGFGPDWTRLFDAAALLGYQPGYQPAARPAAARAFQVGDELEAQQGGRWSLARIVAVKDGQYRVHYDGQPRSRDEWVPAARLRALPGGPVQTPRLAAGKYACTTQTMNSGGTVEFQPKGAVVLAANGTYQYLGFKTPSPGTYRADAASRALSFRGGHLDGGEATPIVQRPGRFYLTAPRIGERWTCGITK